MRVPAARRAGRRPFGESTSGVAERSPRMLVTLGEGGHTTELLRLVRLLGDRYDYHYVVCEEDVLSASRLDRSGPVHRVGRPRGKRTSAAAASLRSLRTFVQSTRIVSRVRPDVVISSGPAVAVPVALAGKLAGAKIVFVETGSRVTSLSLTGRIMYRLADLFFVQWPDLGRSLPRAVYAGRLI